MDFFLTDILGPIFGLVVVFLLIPFLLTILFCSIKNAWENRDRATSKTNTASQSHNATSASRYESDVDDQIDNDSDGTLLSPDKHAKKFRESVLHAWEDTSAYDEFIANSVPSSSDRAHAVAFHCILLTTTQAALTTKDEEDTNYHICCNRYALLDATIFIFFTTRNAVYMNCKQSFVDSFDQAFFATASSYFKKHLKISAGFFSTFFLDRIKQYKSIMLNEPKRNQNGQLFDTLMSFFAKDFLKDPLTSKICIIPVCETLHLQEEVLKIMEATSKNVFLRNAIREAIDRFPR